MHKTCNGRLVGVVLAGIVASLGCSTEYDTKQPIIQLTDCPIGLPDSVKGTYELVEVKTSNLTRDETRVFKQEE